METLRGASCPTQNGTDMAQSNGSGPTLRIVSESAALRDELTEALRGLDDKVDKLVDLTTKLAESVGRIEGRINTPTGSRPW